MEKRERNVVEYYQSTVDYYSDHYAAGFRDYPGNLKRLEILLERAEALGIKTLLDCGCGEGTPMARFLERGVEVWGFDFSAKMAEKADKTLESKGRKNRVWEGDATQASSFRPSGIDLPAGGFDATLAAGVFPHAQDEPGVLRNMASVVRKGGRVFAEFRNELFGFFTLNRHSHELFTEKLLRLEELKARFPEKAVEMDRLGEEMKKLFRMDLPTPRQGPTGGMSIDDIPCKFRNPLECGPFFAEAGLKIDRIHYYHLHAFPPMLEKRMPDLFRSLSLEMENKPSDWRTPFMSSAFVVEAVKG